MNNIYRTDDRGLAAYLLFKGYNCVGAVPANHTDDRRMDFVFIDIEDPKALERSWYREEKELMSARSYFMKLTLAIRIVKEPMTKEQMEALRGN